MTIVPEFGFQNEATDLAPYAVYWDGRFGKSSYNLSSGIAQLLEQVEHTAAYVILSPIVSNSWGLSYKDEINTIMSLTATETNGH